MAHQVLPPNNNTQCTIDSKLSSQFPLQVSRYNYFHCSEKKIGFGLSPKGEKDPHVHYKTAQPKQKQSFYLNPLTLTK